MDRAGINIGRPGRRTAMVLVVAGLLFAVMAYRGMWFAPRYAGPSLSVTQAFDLAARNQVLLIDIRRPDEWRDTGLPRHAHALDMRRDDFGAALTALTAGDRARPIALICARGVRSARLARRLSNAGFDQIINVPEGMLGSPAGPGWLAAGLPVTPVPESGT
ncbi:rhodanese-like domain-containing protein [Sedimentitalea sp. HM32M-2]|uniref:rhodanese-like domain-containing protein n=1 Tax=Sedimentitalea sp. HM32M-2 TaxID=3351566 RepID=UPI003645CCCB